VAHVGDERRSHAERAGGQHGVERRPAGGDDESVRDDLLVRRRHVRHVLDDVQRRQPAGHHPSHQRDTVGVAGAPTVPCSSTTVDPNDTFTSARTRTWSPSTSTRTVRTNGVSTNRAVSW